ncbi:MAG: TerB family tellurite resistance protein [Candidatus Heimdallarchaeota archaeon]|nr:TerB family tellurite resistance protein [Candidatus Heimdallarchaeota archaeon]
MVIDNTLLQSTLKELFKIARKDGVITEEENDIIDQIVIDTLEYSQMIDKAIEDGIIDDEETQELKKLKDQIIKNAEATALADGFYKDHEKELIKKLYDLLNSFYG